MEHYPFLLRALRNKKNALILCAKSGHNRLIPFFPSSDDGFKLKAFMGAVRNGHLEAVKIIHKSLRTNLRQSTILDEFVIEAIKNNHLEIVRYLEDIGTYLESDNYPLKVACHYGYLEISKFLIQRGAPFVDNDGDHILWEACPSGNIPLLEYILTWNRHTKRDLQQSFYWTCHTNHIPMLQRLIELGADPRAENDDGLKGAEDQGTLSTIAFLKDLGLVSREK